MKKTILYLFVFILAGLTETAHTAFAQQVPDNAEEVSPLLISSTIPDVTLKDTDGNDQVLREVVANQPAVLVFYRGGWCPYCNRHLSELQKIEKQITDMGYQIIAISPDRPEKLNESLTRNELNYTLMSDSPMSATRAFGLAFKVDESVVSTYKNDYGIDLEADSGYDHHQLPAPAVYIVAQDGEVLFNYVNPDYRERIDGDILLTAAEVNLNTAKGD